MSAGPTLDNRDAHALISTRARVSCLTLLARTSAKPGIPGVSGKLWQIWICVASQ
jgi:hypothetical protein